MMNIKDKSIYGAIESVLFVAGDPVPVSELAALMDVSEKEMRNFLLIMEETYKDEGRGIIPLTTENTVQFVTNTVYADTIECMLQPKQTKNVSGSLMETLAVVAYKQPVTRSDIETVRGVRCDYAVTQLIKMGLIEQCGQKDVLGHPALFQTTDLFLRKFGLHDRSELPGFEHFLEQNEAVDDDTVGTV